MKEYYVVIGINLVQLILMLKFKRWTTKSSDTIKYWKKCKTHDEFLFKKYEWWWVLRLVFRFFFLDDRNSCKRLKCYNFLQCMEFWPVKENECITGLTSFYILVLASAIFGYWLRWRSLFLDLLQLVVCSSDFVLQQYHDYKKDITEAKGDLFK